MKHLSFKLTALCCMFLTCGCVSYAQTSDIELLKTKWQELLTGGNQLDATNPLAAAYLSDVNQRATEIWNSLIKKPTGTDTRTCLFADLPITSRDKTGSSQITLTYDRLRSLTLAYKMPNTDFSGNANVFSEIIAALNMMSSKHYSTSQSGSGTGSSGAYGNWYDWRIGTPLRYGDLLMMLSDELTAAQMSQYVAPILSNNKAVDLTGANLTWIAGIVAQAGVLIGDADKLTSAKTGLQSVFPYVTTGDGYYADGSFVQHTNYAYTGGYGKALLATIAPLMYVLKGSAWEITYADNVEQNFYDMLFAAYEPVIYGGRMMDMVREREISRFANQDHIPGRQAIRAIVLLLDVLPQTHKTRAESMLKSWLQDSTVMKQLCSDPLEGFLEYYLPPHVITKAQELLDNADITPSETLITHKTFASMDRVVHRQANYGFGISMSSTRIKNTEGTNDEGLRLWHIADGMTYLYNADKSMYADHFWATVDYQRLPGTTVARVTRGTKDGYGTTNPNAWAGGADLDEYGAAGMQFTGMGTGTSRTLKANKSWFMFDDEIVAIGSDISLTSGTASVETTIDNKKIKADFSNVITINGEVQTRTGSSDALNGTHPNVEWLHITGDQGSLTDVGYCFPNKATINAIRETRNGSWDLVNIYEKYVDTTPRQNNFATFWFNHGTPPASASYAYIILPGKSANETQAYNANPDIEILQQNATLHAVHENKLNITAINFWAAGKIAGIQSNAAASVVLHENADGTIDLAVSCPSRANSAGIILDPAIFAIEEVLESDTKITYNATTQRFLVNTSGAYGKTFHVKVKGASITDLAKITADDPVVATQYFNLEGQRIRKPLNGQVYLTRRLHASQQYSISKNKLQP